jgi:uncharacterized membrane protein YtjA (UPF0391 family)
MLRWALIFAVIAIIAGLLGFTGIAGTSMAIAKTVFHIFLVIFVVLLPIQCHGSRAARGAAGDTDDRRIFKASRVEDDEIGCFVGPVYDDQPAMPFGTLRRLQRKYEFAEMSSRSKVVDLPLPVRQVVRIERRRARKSLGGVRRQRHSPGDQSQLRGLG